MALEMYSGFSIEELQKLAPYDERAAAKLGRNVADWNIYVDRGKPFFSPIVEELEQQIADMENECGMPDLYEDGYDAGYKEAKKEQKIMYMKVILLIIALLLTNTTMAQRRMHREDYYVRQWCDQHGGQAEYRLPDRTRVDCLTYAHAFEFDFADKWAEAVGQSLHYAKMSGKTAGIVLIVEDPGAETYVQRVEDIIADNDLDIFLLTITP